ncbi:MAG: 16S rRNA (uracil(1498)-N(3))-methyltransferase [Candidatus Koribacter versatilis]|uniref:Ribosomal RNA small subunit methyltransferase E n=1 Tax=Candidatus Korobacter versatilis TaxID=658062 RepID=A0A932A856_9BACT|nr:16S rRNA (uracil(1498)-N(3))-methyltransferase [Candidatus Koribacter versatilis]
MTRRRWIADETHANRAALTGENAAHLARVLRAKVGQEFDISTGETVRRGRVVSVSDARVEFELGEELPAAEQLPVELLLAVFKFDRMEWAIEKATELGVARIVPVIAQRTERHLAQSAAKRSDRWRRLAHEASQQSRRIAPPEVAEPVKLNAALHGAAGIVLAETEEQTSLKQALARSIRPVRLAIGPEGGWGEEELALFLQHGWQAASLGATILRAETAAIAALAIAASELA